MQTTSKQPTFLRFFGLPTLQFFGCPFDADTPAATPSGDVPSGDIPSGDVTSGDVDCDGPGIFVAGAAQNHELGDEAYT